MSERKNKTLLWLIIMGGFVVFLFRLIDYLVVFSLVLKIPAAILLQYIASGLLGESAFAGGAGTVWLGVGLHFVISMVVATTFLMAAAKLPLIRSNFMLSGILYGVIVWFVMNMVVTPLSAAPPPDPAPSWVLIEMVLGHIILVGLPLAKLARKNIVPV